MVISALFFPFPRVAVEALALPEAAAGSNR
jgi:hypothetical protein